MTKTTCCEECFNHKWREKIVPGACIMMCLKPDCPCHTTENTQESWEGEFENRFARWGIIGDRTFAEYLPNTYETIRAFITKTRAEAKEEGIRKGQMNPKVGFLRQYLNECGKFTEMWTDDEIIRFLRIPFNTLPTQEGTKEKQEDNQVEM